VSSAIPSRTRFLRLFGLWLVLAAVAGCIDAQEDKKADRPPPIVGSGKKARDTQAQPAATDNAPKAGAAGVSTQVGSVLAADGGARPALDSGGADTDAGPAAAGSGVAGSSAALAGRGGSSGASAAGSGGRGGAAGQGGAAGAMPASAACMDQLCFTVLECWLLSPESCNYVVCENFVCR
jgi:hypothetical protein